MSDADGQSPAVEDAFDGDVDAFMLAAREKHRAFWDMPPPRVRYWPACQQCHGTGRAASPVGHVRCSLCRGTGRDPGPWKKRPVTRPKRKRKPKPDPLPFNPGATP